MRVYELPELEYGYDALEPHLSARILELHHGTHHAAYVKGANEALSALDSTRSSGDLEAFNLIADNLAFNVSGHQLHSMFWTNLSPDGGGDPEGELRAAMTDSFGTVDHAKALVSQAANKVRGTGWGALAFEPTANRLIVEQIYDHQHNIAQRAVPLLVIDAWEHAYYLQYEADKSAWTKAFWNLVNWTDVARRFDDARSHALARAR